jgi:formylglycine-generating enzyme required for sulfatase activity
MTATPATGPRTATFLLRQPRQVQGFREQLRPDDQVFVEGVFEQDVFAGDHQNTALTMLWIPPGRFWMGSPATEPGHRDDEGPQHLVQLQGYFMGQTPITQGQWLAVMEDYPSEFGDRPRSHQLPLDRVSWNQAIEFCKKLSTNTGRNYALPSEAQWEYACRAGTTGQFHFGDAITQQLAHYDDDEIYDVKLIQDIDMAKEAMDFRSTNSVVSAGLFPANAWGLHDMHGNVEEWCLDSWHWSYAEAPSDGSAWLDEEDGSSGVTRVRRGGSCRNHSARCRSAARNDIPFMLAGFRVVCCLPQGPSLNA